MRQQQQQQEQLTSQQLFRSSSRTKRTITTTRTTTTLSLLFLQFCSSTAIRIERNHHHDVGFFVPRNSNNSIKNNDCTKRNFFWRRQQQIRQPMYSDLSTTSFLLLQPPSSVSSSSLSPSSIMSNKSLLIRTILQKIPRCGGQIEDDDDDDSDDDDDDDESMFMEDDDDDDTMMDFGSTSSDSIGDTGIINDQSFSQGNYITQMLDTWNNKTPPITKLYLSCSLLITIYSYIFNNNEFPTILLLDWNSIVTKGQIWRLLTSFFNYGPASIGYIMTFQFIWMYMSTLERLNHNKPYDFIILLLFGQLSMIIGYPLLSLNSKFLGHNFSTYLVYIWSKYHEGLDINMFEMFTTKAELLPWFFVCQTFLLEGEIPTLDFLGIVFGHIYHYCYTVGALHAPSSIKDWYHTSTNKYAMYLRELYKPVSADFELAL